MQIVISFNSNVEEGFWVGKDSLRGWRKMALKQIEAAEKRIDTLKADGRQGHIVLLRKKFTFVVSNFSKNLEKRFVDFHQKFHKIIQLCLL